ncbi:MAG: TetR/AcrR family transcriptional regulator [Bacillota bacterium]
MARKKRTDVEVERVRLTILNAAMDLLKNECNFNCLSMRMIAPKANLSVATIYNYYPNKVSLYQDLLQSSYSLLNQCLFAGKSPDHPDCNLREITRRFFKFAVEYKNYYHLIFSYYQADPQSGNNGGTPLPECTEAMQLTESLADIVMAGMDRGEIKRTGDPLELAELFLAAVHGTISLYHSRVIVDTDKGSALETCYIIMDLLLSFLSG